MKIYTICINCAGKGKAEFNFLGFRLKKKCPVCIGEGKIVSTVGKKELQ